VTGLTFDKKSVFEKAVKKVPKNNTVPIHKFEHDM
jgi:hypothetical protein